MPLRSYGVLSGRIVDTRREGAADTPHYQIHVVDDAGTNYRIAVNVDSQQSPSELLFLVLDDFCHPLTAAVVGYGWECMRNRLSEQQLRPGQYQGTVVLDAAEISGTLI